MLPSSLRPVAALPTDFAARVRAARAYAGVASQSEFGKQLEVSGTTVKNWESGRHKPEGRAMAETVRLLAKVSKLPEWFFTVQRLDSLRFAARNGTSEQRLEEIQQSLDRLIGLISGSPEVTGDLFGEVMKAVERGLTRQAREAGLPSPRPGNGQGRPRRARAAGE